MATGHVAGTAESLIPVGAGFNAVAMPALRQRPRDQGPERQLMICQTSVSQSSMERLGTREHSSVWCVIDLAPKRSVKASSLRLLATPSVLKFGASRNLYTKRCAPYSASSRPSVKSTSVGGGALFVASLTMSTPIEVAPLSAACRTT